MINYFYNIILKTDDCDLYSDVLTGIRKDFYLSGDKQKGKITQNSSSDTLYYEFSIEKERSMKWLISDKNSILSDCKHTDDGKNCVNYYGDNGLYKTITFSKFNTLLKVEYFNLTKSNVPYCTIEPRKSGNGLCLLLTSGSAVVKPSVLYAMPYIDDEYVQDKVDLEFEDYTVVASTNEGVVKFLSESQLDAFEEFVDRATAMKLTDSIPESFINDDEAVLAQKLNPKDFNVKRNLSEALDISNAQEFAYDNIEEELLSDIVFDSSDDISVETMADENNNDQNTGLLILEDDSVEAVETIAEPENIEEITIQDVTADVLIEESIEIIADNTDELVVDSDMAVESAVTDDFFETAAYDEPTSTIESSGSKYFYYGELDGNEKRTGFGRTATEDGRTAYEGEYLDNKRNGIGAYFYKNSKLCYYGEWKNNKRNGFGVGVSSVDDSIHVGKFFDNKPEKDGVRISCKGEIEFIRKELSNGMTVELKFDNDKIIVLKYNENGELISENSSNLMYF